MPHPGDELTQRRIDYGAPPDYEIDANLRGYILGTTGEVYWTVEFTTYNEVSEIFVADKALIAEVFEALELDIETAESS